MNSSNPLKKAATTTAGEDDVPVFRVEALMATRREAVLVHGNERYRLRITAKGRLILTK